MKHVKKEIFYDKAIKSMSDGTNGEKDSREVRK